MKKFALIALVVVTLTGCNESTFKSNRTTQVIPPFEIKDIKLGMVIEGEEDFIIKLGLDVECEPNGSVPVGTICRVKTPMTIASHSVDSVTIEINEHNLVEAFNFWFNYDAYSNTFAQAKMDIRSALVSKYGKYETFMVGWIFWERLDGSRMNFAHYDTGKISLSVRSAAHSARTWQVRQGEDKVKRADL